MEGRTPNNAKKSPFNALCRLSERHLLNHPRWRGFDDQLRELALFSLPGDPGQFLPKTYTEEQEEFHNDHFFLPFRETAIEDDAGVVILCDMQPDQTGLESQRHFLIFIPTGDGGVLISGLVRARLRSPGSFLTWADPAKGVYISGDGREVMHYPIKQVDDALPHQTVVHHVSSALQEVMLLNTPSRFIVEQIPSTKRLAGKAVKIPRRDDRSTFTLLKPGDIRKLFQEPEPQDEPDNAADATDRKHASPTPHLRRRHFRTLSADRFTGKKGQVIEVKASWVGPAERTVEGKHYRVRLDL